MRRFLCNRITLFAGTALLAAALATSFKTYSGNPKWSLSGGFHYVVDLHPTSFPVNGVWDKNAQYALADWRDSGGTSFTPGIRHRASNAGNHFNFTNTWIWTNQPKSSWLGVTFTRYVFGKMVDCDIWYNARTDYKWTASLTDPCKNRPYWPIDFRAVARHETGHALGLDHENRQLANMNSIYQHGTGVPHASGSGMCPQADDKQGLRYLYPKSVTTKNLMATCWREPASGSGSARKLYLSGGFDAGSTITVPVYLENQSNVTIPGGVSGVRIGVYLSTNNIISTFDTRIAEYYFTANWGAHAEGYYALKAKIPSTMRAGTYYAGVLIDNRKTVTEKFESDNAAYVGPITIKNKPDLIVSSIGFNSSSVIRGSSTAVTVTVKNIGYDTAKASSCRLFVRYYPGTPSLANDFYLGSIAVSSIAPGASRTVAKTVWLPVTLAGNRYYRIYAVADALNSVPERNETNNTNYRSLYVRWPPATGFYTGGLERVISSSNGLDRFYIYSKRNGTLAPSTFYLHLMTCSGTSPGLKLPPFGTLPLNWDACTYLTFGIYNKLFVAGFGVQDTSSLGKAAYLRGGSWLLPLKGRTIHFATVYLRLGVGLSGISLTAVPMQVR